MSHNAAVYRIPGRFSLRPHLISIGLRVHNNKLLCRKDHSAGLLNEADRTITVIPNRLTESDHIIDVMQRRFPAMRRIA